MYFQTLQSMTVVCHQEKPQPKESSFHEDIFHKKKFLKIYAPQNNVRRLGIFLAGTHKPPRKTAIVHQIHM